jgi:alpha-glucan phosphorylase-like protein
MSNLATKLSQEVNGVSKLHGMVSQKMFSVLYPGYNWEENHVGYVTNSVHYPTWIANEWHKVFSSFHGDNFLPNQSNPDYWRVIHQVPNPQIHATRQGLKAKLMKYVKETIQKDLTHRGESPRLIFDVLNNINENAFVLGFARRFATYKRAQLLFSNMDRLKELVNNAERPVLFLFAGKAHPADKGGQAIIRDIVQISKRPEFIGKIIFLENYNMEMAKLMVQGVDVWLNTPTRPKEASGTSGMKAALNGVVNLSVLDGWWAEGYRPDAGWALPLENTYEDERLQNDLDAETIYYLLETELIPTYFDRDEAGISDKWLSYVKNIMSEVAPHFTMKRMMDDYMARFYNKLKTRGSEIRNHGFAAAKDYALWKRQIQLHWNRLQVTSVDVIDTANQSLPVGAGFSPVIKLDLHGIPTNNIGVEVLFFKRLTEKDLDLIDSHELHLRDLEGSVATYSIDLPMKMAGVYEYGFRIFPKHRLMPHRQDIELIRWI